MPNDLLHGAKRIVFLGDSITEAGGYVRFLEERLRAQPETAEIDIVNSGVSGHKAPDMLNRFDRDVLAYSPDVVFISVGVNDVWHGFGLNTDFPNGDGPEGTRLPRYRESLAKMVDLAQAKGIKVVLLSPTVIYEDVNGLPNQLLRGYIEAMREVAEEKDVVFVDLFDAFEKKIGALRVETGSDRNHLTGDGVHMLEAGDRLMAETIAKTLGV